MKKIRNFLEHIVFGGFYYCVELPYTKLKDKLNELKMFFSNLWRFRKILWRHRTWDYSYCISMLADSFEWLAHDIENGYEEKRSATKKVNAINELVKLLQHTIDDTEFGTFDTETGNFVCDDNYEIDKLYFNNREEVLNRIFEIIKGQHKILPDEYNCHDRFNRPILSNDKYDIWVDNFDGTGIEGWWN